MDDTNVNKIPTTAPNAQTAQSNNEPSTDDQFDDIKKEMRTRFELLPDDIQKALMDEGYQMKLFEIAKAQKLTFEELGLLENETTMVLLGMRNPQDYRDQVQMQLKLNDPAIDSLVSAVNEQVFAPIRASLERVYASRDEEGGTIPTSTPVTQSQTTPTQTSVKIAPPPQVEATNLTSKEKSVLETSGVVLSETPAPIKIVPPSQVSTRTDILKAIENPTRSATSIMADKLTNTGPAMPSKVTDYSIPKPPQGTLDTPPKSSNDPYREPIR